MPSRAALNAAPRTATSTGAARTLSVAPVTAWPRTAGLQLGLRLAPPRDTSTPSTHSQCQVRVTGGVRGSRVGSGCTGSHQSTPAGGRERSIAVEFLSYNVSA